MVVHVSVWLVVLFVGLVACDLRLVWMLCCIVVGARLCCAGVVDCVAALRCLFGLG